MWHQGQNPLSLIRSRCSLLLTWGKVTPEVFFKSGLLRAKESVSQGDQSHMVMPPQPVAAFKVVQSQFVFQLAVVHLDAPARVSDFHQTTPAGPTQTQLCQPVLGRPRFPFRPFDQQPLGDALGMFLGPPAMGRPDLQARETRPLRTASGGAPSHLLPRRGWQLPGDSAEVL